MMALAVGMVVANVSLMLLLGFWIGYSVAGFWLGVALGMIFFALALVPVVVGLDRWGLL